MAAKIPTHNQHQNTFQNSVSPRFNPYYKFVSLFLCLNVDLCANNSPLPVNPYSKHATVAHHQLPSSLPKTPSSISKNTELPVTVLGQHIVNNSSSLGNVGMVMSGTPSPNLEGDVNRMTGRIGYGNKASWVRMKLRFYFSC